MARLLEDLQSDLGWSRGEILSYMNVPWCTYTRWRDGFHNPNINSYFRIMKKAEKLREVERRSVGSN